MLVATAVAVALLWLVGLHVPSHVGVEPARWVPFPGADGWERTGMPDAASFESGVTLTSNAWGTNRLSFAVPLARPAGERVWLRLAGRIVEERRQGKSWATASVDIALVRPSGGRYGHRTIRLVPQPGATRSERFEEIVEWPSGAAAIEVALQSRAGAPTFTLTEASAELVRPNPLYRAAVAGLALVAALWVVVVLRFVRARRRAASLVLPGAAVLAIVVGVTVSRQALRPLLMPVLVWLEDGLGIEREVATTLILKGGHVLGFFLLALGLLALGRRIGVRRIPIVAFAALLALGSEGIQSHLANRGASLADVLIDLVGVAAAFALATLLYGAEGRRKRRRRRRRSSSDRHGSAPGDAGGAPTSGRVSVAESSTAGDAASAGAATDASEPADPERRGGKMRRRRRRREGGRTLSW